MGFSQSFSITVLATYSADFMGLVPMFPRRLGSFEGTMCLVFSLAALPVAEGLAISLVLRLATYWFPLLLSALAAVSIIMEKTGFLSNTN